MKNIVCILVLVLLVASVGTAHMIKGDRHEEGHDYPDNRMEGYNLFGWGMHGPSAPDYECGHGSYGNMGHHGMMPGMMMPGMMGYGMGPGMWGYDANRYDKFLDDTVGMRRSLNNMQFDHSEALRNRDVKRDDLIKMEKEMLELQIKIKERLWNRTD